MYQIKKQLIKLITLIGIFCISTMAVLAQDTLQKKMPADTVKPGNKRTPEERGEGLATRLKDKLALTDAQHAALKGIFTQQEKSLEKYMAEMRVSQQHMMDTLEKVLSAEQFKKFKDMQGRQHQQMPPPVKKPGDTATPEKKAEGTKPETPAKK